MEKGYVIDKEIYNTTNGLYNVKTMVDTDIMSSSYYRILNGTKLKYTDKPGYFLLSIDSKYIFIKESIDINTLFKNIIFSKNNLNYTNEELLEINHFIMFKDY